MTSIERNAIILAAGTSSRFVPLSAELPKGLLEVKGEVLIERQIRQLIDAGIDDITIVVGYKAQMFEYLVEKFGVSIVFNEDFARYNNISSVIRVLDKLCNTYLCSSDNYFPENVFIGNPKISYYSALYADGETGEYCLKTDDNDNITEVSIGGKDSWYMTGHAYFFKDFSDAFKILLLSEYDKEDVRNGYWEDVYIRNIDNLPKMMINRYHDGEIQEFDSIDELREFDSSYINNTRSKVLKRIAAMMLCEEGDLSGFKNCTECNSSLAFTFRKGNERFKYSENLDRITKL